MIRQDKYTTHEEALQNILSSLQLNYIFGILIGRAPLNCKNNTILSRIRNILHWSCFISISVLYLFLILYNLCSIFLENQQSFVINKFIIISGMCVLQIKFYQSVLFSILTRQQLMSHFKLLASVDVAFFRHSILQNFSQRVKRRNNWYILYVLLSVLVKFGLFFDAVTINVKQQITLISAILEKSYVQNLFIILNFHVNLRFQKVNGIIKVMSRTNNYKKIGLNGK